MRFTINKRLAALVLATTVVTTQLQTVAFATQNNRYENNVKSSVNYYTNTFDEESNIADQVNGVITTEDVSIENGMLRIDTNFDGTWQWDTNMHELNFFTSYDGIVEANSVLNFDIILPADKEGFQGALKFKGAAKDENWIWNEGNLGEITSEDFEAYGDGYIKATASVKIESELQGLKAVVLQLIGSEITTLDTLYIDNITVEKLEGGEEEGEDEKPVEAKDHYINEFTEVGHLPGEVNGVISLEDVSLENEMMKFNTNFDEDWGWEENKHEFNFFTDSEEVIPKGACVEFDIVVPNDKLNFSGEIRFKGALKDSAWSWKDGLDGSFTADKFEDLGNGYSKVTAISEIGSELNGLKAVIVQVIGGGTNYTGAMYVDNVKVYNKASSEEVIPEVESMKYNFSEGLDGWQFGGAWDYKKDVEVEHDEVVGDGSLKMALDFSDYKAISWSEVKIERKYDDVDFNGYNKISFDFIYETDKLTSGLFKSKLFIAGVANEEGKIDKNLTEDIGGGLSKIPVTIEFNSKNQTIDAITLSVIGSNTDYKGNIYIDNIEIGQVEKENPYVELTTKPTEQKQLTVDELNMNESVKLVDVNASKATANLYSYLMAVGETDDVIYGHQNDTHHKAVLKDKLTNSDTKDLTGSVAGIIGIDTLSLVGNELQLTDEEVAEGLTLPIKAARMNAEAAKDGAIITMSAHMPNFDRVYKEGKDDNGDYNYHGYDPGLATGNVVERIMPGGELNEVYTGYLDLIAEYANELAKDDVPVLFRPFHENNGSWFWWGKAFCDEEAYKNLFRYTVEYLRDTKEVNNFLYVYSPNGPFEDEEDYLQRYPGDEFIDIIAFDMYHDNPGKDASTDPWMSTLRETIELVQGIADERGKLAALSETGIRIDYGCMPVTDNANKEWFQDVSDIVGQSNMPYFMSWANFDEGNVFAPYLVSEKEGHEMINEFVDYYNHDTSIFADGNANLKEASTTVGEAYAYGFITSPASGSRILDPTTITASVKNVEGKVQFVIKDNSGKEIKTLNAKEKDGVYSADISNGLLKQIGETIGTIELVVGNKEKQVLNTINVIFNMEEQEVSINMVDDFESYSGENALLEQKWTTDFGGGCSVKPSLTTDSDKHNKGNYGLAFNYNINTDKISEGYAGITKSLDNDWTGYDALRMWVNPDGEGQKLVIQLRSYGQDFEWHLTDFVGTTEAKEVTLMFEDLIAKSAGAEFDPSSIERFAIYCNTIDGKASESVIYFDDIRAVDSTKAEDEDKDEDKEDDKDNDKDDEIIIKPEDDKDKDKDKDSDKDKLPQTGGVNSLALITAAIGAMGIGGALTRNKKYKK